MSATSHTSLPPAPDPRRDRFHRAKLIFRAYEAELLAGNVQRARVLLERWRRVLAGGES